MGEQLWDGLWKVMDGLRTFFADPVVLAVSLAAVGVLAGWAISRYFFNKGGAKRGTVRVSVRQLAAIGFGPKGFAKIGTHNYKNLILVEIKVTNGGPGDFHDPSYRDEALRSRRPQILLEPSFQAVLDPWSLNPWGPDDGPVAELRTSRYLRDGTQVLGLNLGYLGEGISVVNHVLLTDTRNPDQPELQPADLTLVRGFVKDRTVTGGGLLRRKRALAELPRKLEAGAQTGPQTTGEAPAPRPNVPPGSHGS